METAAGSRAGAGTAEESVKHGRTDASGLVGKEAVFPEKWRLESWRC